MAEARPFSRALILVRRRLTRSRAAPRTPSFNSLQKLKTFSSFLSSLYTNLTKSSSFSVSLCFFVAPRNTYYAIHYFYTLFIIYIVLSFILFLPHPLSAPPFFELWFCFRFHYSTSAYIYPLLPSRVHTSTVFFSRILRTRYLRTPASASPSVSYVFQYWYVRHSFVWKFHLRRIVIFLQIFANNLRARRFQ